MFLSSCGANANDSLPLPPGLKSLLRPKFELSHKALKDKFEDSMESYISAVKLLADLS